MASRKKGPSRKGGARPSYPKLPKSLTIVNYRSVYGYSKKDVQIIVPELSKIRKSKGLSREKIVNAAKAKSSPLHKYFEWDDKKAAHKWRMAQAGKMMQVIKVTFEDNKGNRYEGPGFVSTTDVDGGEYKPTEEAMSNPKDRKHILDEALEGLLEWKARYEFLQTTDKILNPVFAAITKAGAAATRRKKRRSKKK